MSALPLILVGVGVGTVAAWLWRRGVVPPAAGSSSGGGGTYVANDGSPVSGGSGTAGGGSTPTYGGRTMQVTGYRSGQPFQMEVVEVQPGKYLERRAAQAFQEMWHLAYNLADIELHINSAFRSMEDQQRLYDRYLAGQGALAARPGYSNHQSGIAVDIQTDGGTNAAYRWMQRNAYISGFVELPAEVWHWDYKPNQAHPPAGIV